MELFLVRFLTAATLLLAVSLVCANLVHRKRGAYAASDILRLSLLGVPLCALLALLPASLPAVTELSSQSSSEQLQTLPAFSAATEPEKKITHSLQVLSAQGPYQQPSPSPFPILELLLSVWSAGSLIGLGMLLRGHFLLLMLRRKSKSSNLFVQEGLEVRDCPGLNAPLLAGCRRPVLYLPESGLLREEASALAAALAHELAHLRRHDLRWAIFARLLCVTLWFHPLLWLTSRALAQLAEECSDELAVAVTNDRRAYADLLLRLSEQPPLRLAAPVVGMALFHSRTGKRIAALLSCRLSQPLSQRGKALLGLVASLVLLVGTSLVGKAQRIPPQPVAPTSRRARPSVVSSTTVTLSLTKRPLQEAVREISRVSRFSISVAPSLSGTITLQATDASLETVLTELCAQIQPAAWFVGRGGQSYELAPLPPVGKVQGKVVGPDGKPVAGAQVVATIGRIDTRKAALATLALIGFSRATSRPDGTYTLERVAAEPYQLTVQTDAKSQLVALPVRIEGKANTTQQAQPLRLVRGIPVRLVAQVPGDSSILIHSRIRYNNQSIGTWFYSNNQQHLVPPGKLTIAMEYANKAVARVRLTGFSGGEHPLLRGSEIELNPRSGESLALSLEVALTPEQQKRRNAEKVVEAQFREDIQQEERRSQARMHRVRLPTTPISFADAVRSLCTQAGVKQVTIAPEISGTVQSKYAQGFFEHALIALGRQTNPVAFPVWSGTTLKIVAAPAPGVYDPRYNLYRLQSAPIPMVFEEKNGGSGATTDGATGFSLIDIFVANQAKPVTVQVLDYDHEDAPLAGVTVTWERRGQVTKLTTDDKGEAHATLLPGKNYLAVQSTALAGAGTSYESRGLESRATFKLRKRGAPALDPRFQKRVSLSVKDMPYQDAIRQVCAQVGVTQIKFPKDLEGKVTITLKDKPCVDAIVEICKIFPWGVFPELREPLTFYAPPDPSKRLRR